MAFVAAGLFVSAQGLFVGGNIGMNTENSKFTVETGGISASIDGPKWFGFEFNPTVGYMFNDNMGVGLDLMFVYGKTTEKLTDEDGDYTKTTKETSFGFAPYFRFIFAEIDDFQFYADAKVSYRKYTPKYTFEQGGISASMDGDKTTQIGIGVVPGMKYNFTDNISMNCRLNILSLGYTSTKMVSEDGDYKETEKISEFDFGVNDPTPITIGFLYTF